MMLSDEMKVCDACSMRPRTPSEPLADVGLGERGGVQINCMSDGARLDAVFAIFGDVDPLGTC